MTLKGLKCPSEVEVKMPIQKYEIEIHLPNRPDFIEIRFTDFRSIRLLAKSSDEKLRQCYGFS